MVEGICIKNFCVILFRNTLNHTSSKYVTYLLEFFFCFLEWRFYFGCLLFLCCFAEHKLKQQLGKIRSNVDKFQRDLRDVKPSPEFVEKLKEIMEEIENSMMTFKEQQRKVYVFCLIECCFDCLI